MRISFPYEERHSKLLGRIKRPYARVSVWSSSLGVWLDYAMLVDTGADYTLFPRSAATDVGVNLENDCEEYETKGIGGKETVFLLKKRLSVHIGDMKKEIIAGILARDDLPPVLGRTSCLDDCDVLFSIQQTYFDVAGGIVRHIVPVGK